MIILLFILTGLTGAILVGMLSLLLILVYELIRYKLYSLQDNDTTRS